MLIDMESVECSKCKGDGDIEKVVWHPHNFDRDIGCESSTIETCDQCNGDGRIPCET
jgi:DnaJ-class molecular chaperone